MQHHDALRLKHTPHIVDELLDDLADLVAGKVRSAPKDAKQSGDDTIHHDQWEEFKDQVQRQHSTSFGLYEDMVRADCEAVLESLRRYQRELLWLWSDDFLERDRYPGDTLSHASMDSLVETLYRRVCERADAEDMLFDEYRVDSLIPEGWDGFSEVDLTDIQPAMLVDHTPDVVRFMQGKEDYGEGVAATMAENYLHEVADRDGMELDGEEYRDRIDDLTLEFRAYLEEWRRRVLETPPSA